MSNISFHIISKNDYTSHKKELYQEAYKTFKLTWKDTFSEIFLDQYQYTSNDFTRQDYIQAIFKGPECIALDCIRKISFLNPAHIDDSWLLDWNKNYFQDFVNGGYKDVLINSYFTVRKDHRKTLCNNKYHIGYIMGALSVLHQLELDYDLMLGMMRNSRSMNDLGKKWGSVTIEEGILHNQEPTDLVIFKSEFIKEASKSFPPIVFELFNQKNNHFYNEEINEKAA